MQLVSEDPVKSCTVLRNVVHFSAVDTLGHTSRKHQDWWISPPRFTRHIKMIQALYPSRQPTATSVSQSKADRGMCKIPGWAKKRRKSSPLQTERTRRRSPMMHYRQFNVQRALEPLHFLVQIEEHFWHIKMLSWNGGPNISIVCPTAHQKSTTMPSTDCHRWSAMHCLMNSQLSLKQRKQFSICHRARSLVQTQNLQRSIQQEVNQWQRNLQSCLSEGKRSSLWQP